MLVYAFLSIEVRNTLLFVGNFLVFLMLSWDLNYAWEKEENKAENNTYLGKYNRLRKVSQKEHNSLGSSL